MKRLFYGLGALIILSVALSIFASKPLFPILKTPEQQLELRHDGLTYTHKGVPFTGASVFMGEVETYPQEETFTASGRGIVPGSVNYSLINRTTSAHSQADDTPSTTRKGKRITRYLNGLKEGKEQLYYIYRSDMFGYFGGPEVVSTVLHAQSEYHNGLKDGLEIINYHEMRMVEAHFKAGVLDGMYREYHMYRDYYLPKRGNSKIGPLMLEAQYHNGNLEGWYSTYNYHGDTSEHYLVQQAKVIEGRIRTKNATYDSPTTVWQWYKDGTLVAEREYDKSASYPDNTEPISVSGVGGAGRLMREEFYDMGQLTELRMYNTDNNRVHLHKKRIQGVLVETFNRETGVNRIAEFGLE